MGGLATSLPQYFLSQFEGDQTSGDSDGDATDCQIDNLVDELSDEFGDTESNYV